MSADYEPRGKEVWRRLKLARRVLRGQSVVYRALLVVGDHELQVAPMPAGAPLAVMECRAVPGPPVVEGEYAEALTFDTRRGMTYVKTFVNSETPGAETDNPATPEETS